MLVQVGGGEAWGLTTGAKALFCFTAETMLAGEKEKMPEELLQLEGRLVEEAMVGLDGTTGRGNGKAEISFSPGILRQGGSGPALALASPLRLLFRHEPSLNSQDLGHFHHWILGTCCLLLVVILFAVGLLCAKSMLDTRVSQARKQSAWILVRGKTAQNTNKGEHS